MTEESAIKVIRNGMIAASIYLIIIVAMTTISLLVDGGNKYLEDFNDPLNYLDIPIFGLLIFGLYKRGRIVGIILISGTIYGLVLSYMENGNFVYIPVLLALLYFYLRATMGCFALHKMKPKEQKKNLGAWGKVLYPLLGIVAFIMVIIITFVVFISFQYPELWSF